jgi:ubiquinone/menaquinone biosynthesis C-methylase UbiE
MSDAVPDFFSLELAKMVGRSGKVISADLQEGMLQKLHDKIKGTELEERTKLVHCDKDKIKVLERVDFILAFYMVHEIIDKNSFFKELKNILNEKGQFLIVEPKLFHVSQKEFDATAKLAEYNGFKIYHGPKLPLSWSAILKNT